MSLKDIVLDDINRFLKQDASEIMFNERDFQMHLALYLKNTRNYDDVDLEYYVPREELDNYEWDSELRIDIVVMKHGEFLPIELKYKTKKIEQQIKRFNEQLKEKYAILKNQGAQDLGMYDFWKDVRRIELVRKRFSNVKNGVAVFVTNDKAYMKKAKSTSNYCNFCMQEGTTPRNKEWINTEAAIAKTRPGFILEKEYEIHWHDISLEGVCFYFCSVCI